MLSFRDPRTLVAGNLHGYLPSWERISKVAPCLKNFVSAFPVTASSTVYFTLCSPINFGNLVHIRRQNLKSVKNSILYI